MSKQRALFGLLVEHTCKELGLKLEKEYLFATGRKFRFDYAIPEIMVACEYEGILAGKARHTTITGYTNDCIKYNLATVNGWKVLRYTAINYSGVDADIKEIFKHYCDSKKQ